MNQQQTQELHTFSFYVLDRLATVKFETREEALREAWWRKGISDVFVDGVQVFKKGDQC